MKFIVDESTGKKVADFLSAAHDVIYVGDSARGSSDKDVLLCANNEGRIIITNDKDFGDLIFRQHGQNHGVILLRLRKDTPKSRINVLEELIARHSDKLPHHFTVVSESGVRVRKTQ